MPIPKRTTDPGRDWPQLFSLACVLACFGCGESSLRSDCNPNPHPGELGTICGFHNPEDVEVIPQLDALIVSEMRHEPKGRGGSLAFVDLRGDPLSAQRLWPTPQENPEAVDSVPEAPPSWLDPTCTDAPPPDQFSPHGISARPIGRGSFQLAVVSHSPREAIEVFGLQKEAGSLRASWLGCVLFPPDTIGNDVAWGHRDSLVATRYQPTREQPRAAFYSVLAGLGFDTGEVLRKRPEQDWVVLSNSGGASPNGVIESSTTGLVYFSQTGDGSITALRKDSAVDVSIGGHPDNLAWSNTGTILAVTHTEGLAFVRCAMGRLPCRTAWSLFEIVPESLDARLLYSGDGEMLGAVASVSQNGDRYFFGSVFDDRIGVWSSATSSPDTRHRP